MQTENGANPHADGQERDGVPYHVRSNPNALEPKFSRSKIGALAEMFPRSLPYTSECRRKHSSAGA